MDEALLEAAIRLQRPVLRFYGWTEPAATFGYFQKFAEVERLTRLRPLIRRPTGGGLVPHDADWTYSLVFPPGASWYRLRAVESYQRVHCWIQAAFKRIGLEAELSPGAPATAPGQCFVGAEQFDLVQQGRKIAGAAQRRNRQGLLIQGSIQPPTAEARPAWETAFCALAAEQWGVEWMTFEADAEMEERVKALTTGKYRTAEYNNRR